MTASTREIRISADAQDNGRLGHAFRDGYAVTGEAGLPVTVAGRRPVTFDNCRAFTVTDASGLARVVGGYNPKTATDEVDRAPARLGLDQDGGRIPWTAPASAPLQFTSVKPYVLNPANPDDPQAQVLMRASKRATDGTQASLWSLRTAGTDRRLIQFFGETDPQQPEGALAFEFDVAKSWLLTAPKNNQVNSGDPTTDNVIRNMRTRIAELEAVIQDLAKNAVRRPPEA